MASSSSPEGTRKLSWHATWAMAVGGMIGGGIFSVLGVVVEAAGRWAWVSFLIAGAIALATAESYVRLARRFGEGGGAFMFLREVHREGLAGSLSWVLIVGYTLTISVYAFTFGHYLMEVFGASPLLARGAGVAAVAVLAVVNLRGVGSSATVEVFTVWGKLVILLGLGAIGLWRFEPAQLEVASQPGLVGIVVGAAAVFMAYEGFQLLAYDYADIQQPERTLASAMPIAVITVAAIYVVVTLGAASLVGAPTLVEQREVALAAAGRAAAGHVGLVLVSVAAIFSTSSAINATLFATARLAVVVAEDGELPSWVDHRNQHDVPDRALLTLGGLAAVLAATLGLTALVEAASLVFLLTFAVVNVVALRVFDERRWLAGLGAAGAGSALVVLTVRLVSDHPVALGVLVAVIAAATLARPLLLRGASGT